MGWRRRWRTLLLAPFAEEKAAGRGGLYEVVKLLGTEHVEAEEFEGDALMSGEEYALENIVRLVRDGQAVAQEHRILFIGVVTLVNLHSLVPRIVTSDHGGEDDAQCPHIIRSRGVCRVDSDRAEAFCWPFRGLSTISIA